MPLTTIKSSNIKDSEIKNADISPTASITESKIAGLDASQITTNAFNIGVLGFKMAVSDGLTIFNLVDGVVDEFNDESGIDTGENSNAAYDATSDFYSNISTGDYPGSPYVVSDFTNPQNPSTYTAPPTATAVDLLVVGGGGGGSDGHPSYAGGGGGAGGLIFLENLPVTGGATYSVTVGEGGEGKGYPGSGVGEDGGDTTFVYSPSVNIIGEGGGAGGNYNGPSGSGAGFEGGSSGGHGYVPEATALEEFTQATNHPIPGITPAGDNAVDQSPNLNLQGSYGGDGSNSEMSAEYIHGAGGGAGEHGTEGAGNVYAVGGAGLPYDIADGSTPIVYAGGGGGSGGYPMPASYSPEAPGGGGRGIGGSNAQAEPADATPQNPLLNGTSPPQFGPQIAALSFGGGGGGGGNNGSPGTIPSGGGNGGSGVVYVSVSETTSNSMTLVSDTFTANSTPSTSRVVLFAEIADDLNTDVAISVTRDNTTYNSVSLTDTGYVSGSSGIKIYTGSTPLTGSASPQVQMRWKVTGSTLTGANKIHGVALQWA